MAYRSLTYSPLMLESLQIHELTGDVLVTQIRLVLLQKSTAYLGVFGLGKGVFDVRFLETVEGDDDAVDFGKRVIQISFSCCF